ncbi:DNA polymerase zeta catalytic subunit-like [Pyrus ussuriensis x Pyrus communis]|uniref:DNA polymerase zeta catalytic subunit-like n=1 Tax=Pyrus ussuriensis x Pyrus communis TaxID=2448454 RepID=A0A5N5I6Y2_9ROSA|nr:DNA polymerase zeta catalytic subunit-like [Pyrus ussuriensis x Pyrus communis]
MLAPASIISTKGKNYGKGTCQLHIETKDPNGTSSSSENEVGKRAGTGTCDAKDSGMLARCSVRNLMRRNSRREENEDTLLYAKRLDFPSGIYKAYKYDSKPTNPGCSLYEVGAGTTAQFRNSLIRDPSQVPSVNERIQTWSAEHEVADGDGFVESGFESLSSKVGVYEMPFENLMRANATTVSAVLNNKRSGVQKLGRDSVSSELRHSPPEFIYPDDEDLIGMTCHIPQETSCSRLQG